MDYALLELRAVLVGRGLPLTADALAQAEELRGGHDVNGPRQAPRYV